jgi:hypothetical protein|tara:strand:- start:298 stop:441 length:144 start_codon:yes stop_codon:yes gene_type:complete
MEKWLRSLSKKELRTWIKHMSSLPILFFATNEEKENLKIAKNILINK